MTPRNMGSSESREDVNMDPYVRVASEGDVYLVAGLDQVRVKVDSRCLRGASPVFNAMFGPNWSQGKNAEGMHREVMMEDEDAEALILVCHVLHHRNETTPKVLSASTLFRVAVLSDKWDLNVALKYAIRAWLLCRGSETDPDHQGFLLAAALLFRARDVFAEITNELVLGCKGSFLKLVDRQELRDVIPLKLLRLMEERRSNIRVRLVQLLAGGITGGAASNVSQRSLKREQRWVCQTSSGSDDVWFLEASLSQILDYTRGLTLPPSINHFRVQNLPLKYSTEAIDMIVSTAKIFLDCVLDDETTNHDLCCRFTQV